MEHIRRILRAFVVNGNSFFLYGFTLGIFMANSFRCETGNPDLSFLTYNFTILK